VIDRYCFSAAPAAASSEDYERVQRLSRMQAHKWQAELTCQQIEDLRAGYLQSPFNDYRSPEDWPV
jgi:hypothetical protein